MQSYKVAEDLGKAFSERLVLESSLAAERQASRVGTVRVLALLRSLYVLSAADEATVFLRYVTPTHTHTTSKEIPAKFKWPVVQVQLILYRWENLTTAL